MLLPFSAMMPGFGPGLDRISRSPALWILSLVLALGAPHSVAAQAAGTLLKLIPSPSASKTPAPPPPATPGPIQPIPLPNVAARSEELIHTLNSLEANLPTQQELDDTESTLEEREPPLQAKRSEVEALLSGTPSSLEIREQETYWRNAEAYSAESSQQLLTWANAAQSAIQLLSVQEQQWNATLQANQSTAGLGPVLDVIHDSLQNIHRVEARAQDQLRTIVNMQVRAGMQDQIALGVLSRLAQARVQLQRHLMQRDSLPLWQVTSRKQNGENAEVYTSMSSRVIGIRAFVEDRPGVLTALFLFWLLCEFLAYRLYRAVERWSPQEERDRQVQRIAQHWFALGFLAPLLCAYSLAPSAPLVLIGVMTIVSFVPILTLLPPLLEPRFRLMLYYLTGVYAVTAVVNWFTLSAAHKREVQFVSQLVIVIIFAMLVRPGRIRHLEQQSRSRWIAILGMRIAILMFVVALIANFFGYVKLSQFFAVSCLYSTFIAISVSTGVRVFSLLLLAGAHSPAAERLAMIRQHRGNITRWLPRVLWLAGGFVWLTATLDLLSIRDWVNQQVAAVLGFHLAGTTASITLGGVLGFFLILVGGYAVSSAIRFLLREELLARMQLKRGFPELISTTLHYLILLLVFFFAVNAGGIELNKFTLLTGALGVGVGFGLQNVINNFVSGLILQFERPVHVGDVLDVEGASGKVTRIGIRSSTILTPQGAEIIIPNGDLISNRVTNWTLTEAVRRVELPVGVAYGSDLKLVMKLLADAAATHESVLTKPEPVVYLRSFADSSLNFELHFWVMLESNPILVQSEVAVAASHALEQAGIEIPFPQRDLRLRSVDPIAAGVLTGNGTPSEAAGVSGPPEFEGQEAHHSGAVRRD